MPGHSSRSLASRLATKTGASLLVAAVILAPLLYGAATTRSVAWLLLFIAPALALAPHPRTAGCRFLLSATAICFVAWLSVATLQALPLDTPWTIPLVQEVRSLLGVDIVASSLTINASRLPDAAARALLVSATLAAAALHGQNRNFAFRAMSWFIYSGLAITLLAMAAYAVEPRYVLWYEKTAYVRDFTATFINRGAAGAWLCLLAMTCLVLAIRTVQRVLIHDVSDDASTARRVVEVLAAAPIVLTVLSAGAFAAAAGMLLTQSRAALLTFVLEVLVLLIIITRQKSMSWRGAAIAGAALIGAALFLINFAGQGVSDRVSDSGIFDEGRWAIWLSAVGGIVDRPLLGFGAGTFRDMLPLYRSADLVDFGVIVNAHSLPIELAAEMGLPVAILICACWFAGCVALGRMAVIGVRFDAVRVAGLIAAIGAAFFVSVDVVSFSFGYVVPMLVFVGMGLAQPLPRAEFVDDDAGQPAVPATEVEEAQQDLPAAP